MNNNNKKKKKSGGGDGDGDGGGHNKQQQTIPDTESDEDYKEESGAAVLEGGGGGGSSSAQQPKPPPTNKNDDDDDRNFMEVFMSWYADRLLLPWVKIVVIFVFLSFFAGCTYSTTFLYQEFNVGDYVPKDSMLTSFTIVFQEYTSIQRFIGVYFRNVDQSDPLIQDQMIHYVEELAELPQIGEPPAFFWVRDFNELSSSEQVEEIASEAGIDFQTLTFNQQIGAALNYPPIRQVYDQDIVRDEVTGDITASRTFLYLREIDMKDIKNQMDMLFDQREITRSQPANSPENLQNNGDELSFFTFDDFYFFWELYAITVDELIFTTVCCVAVVTFIALVFIPHWSAVSFVTPLIIMLYFMLLGTMQFCGITINSITYFIIVMAIGLLVDFLMHVLLRYFETKGTNRHARVKETLETMGASILLGGFTTFLGVIPLAFSTTKTFMTVFISFLAMVVLGCSVGLAFLPVLLSIVGPVDVAAPPTKGTKPLDTSNKECNINPTLTRQTTALGAESDSSFVEVCAQSNAMDGFMQFETIASGSWSPKIVKSNGGHENGTESSRTREDEQPTELHTRPGSPQPPRAVSKAMMVEGPKHNSDEKAEQVSSRETSIASPSQEPKREPEDPDDMKVSPKTLEGSPGEDPKPESSSCFPNYLEEPDFYFM